MAREQIQFSLDFGADNPLAEIRSRLMKALGADLVPSRARSRLDPCGQFVKALISSQTFDATSGQAFEAVRKHYRPLETLAATSLEELYPLIETVTHAGDKARQLLASARRLIAERGRFDLSYLAAWPIEDAMVHLQGFEGIGPKCAAATLNFSTLRRRILVVDSHVRRVAIRLGLLPAGAGFAQAHRLLLRQLPPAWDAEELTDLHWLMKRLGQQVCTSQRPHCRDCPLADLCATGSKTVMTRRIQ